MNRQIINVETGEEVIIPIEQTELEKLQVEFIVAKQKASVKESAKADLLAKLGITEEEAQLLLGGN